MGAGVSVVAPSARLLLCGRGWWWREAANSAGDKGVWGVRGRGSLEDCRVSIWPRDLNLHSARRHMNDSHRTSMLRIDSCGWGRCTVFMHSSRDMLSII